VITLDHIRRVLEKDPDADDLLRGLQWHLDDAWNKGIEYAQRDDAELYNEAYDDGYAAGSYEG
jgi:hypothetical protein